MNQRPFRTALILEPHLLKRQALKGMLQRRGFSSVLVAEQVLQALTLLKEQPVDVVLTPWQVEGGESAESSLAGVPLLEALRQSARGVPPALILLDEGLPRPAVVAAVKAGIAGRLPLPAEESRLAEILGLAAAPAPQPA